MYDGTVILIVDVMIDERVGAGERPAPGSAAIVELRDVTAIDAAAVTLARRVANIADASGRRLLRTKLTVDQSVDPRADLTVWVRITESPDDDLTAGDWITMQSVPVDTESTEQQVTAPVRRIG